MQLAHIPIALRPNPPMEVLHIMCCRGPNCKVPPKGGKALRTGKEEIRSRSFQYLLEYFFRRIHKKINNTYPLSVSILMPTVGRLDCGKNTFFSIIGALSYNFHLAMPQVWRERKPIGWKKWVPSVFVVLMLGYEGFLIQGTWSRCILLWGVHVFKNKIQKQNLEGKKVNKLQRKVGGGVHTSPVSEPKWAATLATAAENHTCKAEDRVKPLPLQPSFQNAYLVPTAMPMAQRDLTGEENQIWQKEYPYKKNNASLHGEKIGSDQTGSRTQKISENFKITQEILSALFEGERRGKL